MKIFRTETLNNGRKRFYFVGVKIASIKQKSRQVQSVYIADIPEKGIKIIENPELWLGNIGEKKELAKKGCPLENTDMLMAQQVAASFITNDMHRIVNIGSGIGAFENYVAQQYHDKHFVASEFDRPSVEWSKENRAFANVDYCSDDIEVLLKKYGKFDLAVNIDVIEHVKNYKDFLDDFVRLSDRAIIATPNRDSTRMPRMVESGGGKHPLYPYHIREFNYGELYYILKMYYKNVKIFAQPDVFKPKIVEVGFYTTYERFFAYCSND